MKNIGDYIRYYNIENYLFNEVKENFNKHKVLSPSEFFAIINWKSNRSKGLIKNGLKIRGTSIRYISKLLASIDLDDDNSARSVIYSLAKGKNKIIGIGIPMISAILTVLYPRHFTVVDYRAIFTFRNYYKIEFKSNPSNSIEGYFEYLAVCKRLSKEQKMTLRDFDRAVWGYSNFSDLEEYTKGLR